MAHARGSAPAVAGRTGPADRGTVERALTALRAVTDADLSDLLALAADLTGVEVAALAVADDESFHYPVTVGTDAFTTPYAEALCRRARGVPGLFEVPDTALDRAAATLTALTFHPTGTEGYAKAEVTAGGIVLTVFGARLLVEGAVSLAEGLGVSETVIGLTVVAVGTSLPELVACVVAALRRHSDVAVGNVIGSNVYNALGILGVTAMVSPIRIPPEVIRLDIWVLLAATALLAVFLRTGGGLKRLEGAAFLLAYAAYVGFLATGGI